MHDREYIEFLRVYSLAEEFKWLKPGLRGSQYLG